VGGLSGSAASKQAADLGRVPLADPTNGAREFLLGYFRIGGKLLKLDLRWRQPGSVRYWSQATSRRLTGDLDVQNDPGQVDANPSQEGPSLLRTTQVPTSSLRR
jgi:hypothetical protein